MRCLVGLLLCLVLAPAATAEPVALMDAPLASGVALAGAEVVVTHDLPSGAVTVDAVSVHGGAGRRLLSVPPPPERYGHAVVAASAERVAVLVEFEEVGGLPRQLRIYSGPPSGPLELLVSRRVKRLDAWVPSDVDVDGNRILVSEFRIHGRRLRARVLEPGLAPAPVPGSGSLFGRTALAGDYVAFPDGGGGAPGVDRVVVVDRRTGAVAASLALDPDKEYPGEIDLAPDGRVVVAVRHKLLTAAPGQPRAVLPGAFSAPRFAGETIAALQRTRFDAHRPVVLDAGAPRALGMLSTDVRGFDGDAAGLAWIANGCVLYSPVDGAPATAPPEGPCPRAEVVFDETDETLHGRRIRIAVRCIAAPLAGCRGSVILGDRRPVGRGRFSVPAGARRVVDVVLTRRGLRRVRRALAREGDAFLKLDAAVEDGRAPWVATQGVGVDRVAR